MLQDPVLALECAKRAATEVQLEHTCPDKHRGRLKCSEGVRHRDAQDPVPVLVDAKRVAGGIRLEHTYHAQCRCRRVRTEVALVRNGAAPASALAERAPAARA